MLSAVAARKARLAHTHTPPAAPSPDRPSPPSRSPPISNPPPKRKHSAPAGNVNKKKKQRHPQASAAPAARYFVQDDGFRAQDDVILVDEQDNDSSSLSSTDELLPSPAPPHTHAPRPSRAWSPSAPMPDSSDEDDEEPPFNATRVALIPPSSVLSTFTPILNQNVFNLPPAEDLTTEASTVILLKLAETIALVGTYTVCVLNGAITLAGVALTTSPTPHPVFAPRSSPIPTIECLRKSSSSGAPTPIALPDSVIEAAKNYDAIIMLRALRTGIERLGKVCRPFDGCFSPARWLHDRTPFDLALDNVYFLGHSTPDISPFVVPSSWDAAIEYALSITGDDVCVVENHVHLVKGPRNVGKSSFARLALNRFLSRYRRVAYLDCDLGQSEFAPGGMVSLNVLERPIFGPPFSHPSIPYAAHYVGSTSPQTAPSHYLDCIQALMQVYHTDLQFPPFNGEDAEDERINSTIPLVINTMGWTKGLGGDLSRKIEEIVEPSHIYSFDDPFQEGIDTTASLPSFPRVTSDPRIQNVEPVPPSPSSSHYTAADVRALTMLSYLYANFPDAPSSSLYSTDIATGWEVSLPLCAQPPYEVDCATAFDRLILTGAGMEDVVPMEVHRVLNGAVVGLVSYQTNDPDETHTMPDDSFPTPVPYEQGSPPPSPHTSKCIGLALVRAVPPPSSPSSTSRIQLLTPVPPRLLGSSRVLVMGEVRLPIWGMLDFRTLDEEGDIAGFERGAVPYLQWGKGEGAGGRRRRVRRNLMRKGQM